MPIAAYFQKPLAELPFPLSHPNCRFFTRARHGLHLALSALDLSPGDEALVPAYHHGSEIEALHRAGIMPRFYAGGVDLQPDADELQSLIGPRTRALYITHFLGFPQDGALWRQWCDQRGLLLLEDAAHALLAQRDGRPAGEYGDLAIFCLYKTFGLPHGAATVGRVAVDSPPAAARLSASRGALLFIRHHVDQFAHGSHWLARLLDRGTDPEYDPAADFDLGDRFSPIPPQLAAVVRRVVHASAAARRRANYSLLLSRLAHLVPEPFDRLPPGASPLFFPVETADKAAFLSVLRRHGIRALNFWSTPHPLLPVERFPREAQRRARTIGLPVHQELRPAELDRIASAALAAASDNVVTHC